ncbi:MAG TPA: sulfotransferase [Balneolaceae bacterium]|nr:sulfotransferase [Balneolaceae bacterium]
MTDSLSFKGPLFIVGAGRSGTKLLRRFLNNHSSISLTIFETKFIPDFIAWEQKKSRSQLSIDHYFSFLKDTTFYHRASRQKPLDESLIKSNIPSNEPADFIENILKYYSVKFHNFDTFNYIWGDKSPLYLRHTDLLFGLYPSAKILHIIRDPRDVALSYRKTWGKSLSGTAEKWRSLMAQSGNIRNPNYFELHYEDLIQAPEKILTNICDFLDIPYEPSMGELNKEVEKSSTSGQTNKILRNNFQKYKQALNSRQVQKIERITKKYLLLKGYSLENDNIDYKPLSSIQKDVLRITDFLSFIYHLIKEEDFKTAMLQLKYVFKNI